MDTIQKTKNIIRKVLLVNFFLIANPVLAAPEISFEFITAELQRAETNPDHSVEILIPAPIDFVFGFLSQRLDEYIADAVAVEFDHADSNTEGEVDIGSIRKITLEDSNFLVQRFLRFDPYSGYAYLTDMERSSLDAPIAYSITTYNLSSPAVNETTLRVSVVYKPTTRLLGFFVRRVFNSAFKRDFENAAQVISSEYEKMKVK